MSETWKPWRDGAYEASDLGRVRRAKPGRRTHVGRVMTPTIAGAGYPMATLTISGKNTPTLVHLMVAECFLGPTPDGQEVNHKDGDKTNARASNLEHRTHRGNMEHASETGLMAHGERHYAAKLTDVQVRAIRAAKSSGESYASIADRFEIAISHCWEIVKGKARRSA